MYSRMYPNCEPKRKKNESKECTVLNPNLKRKKNESKECTQTLSEIIFNLT